MRKSCLARLVKSGLLVNLPLTAEFFLHNVRSDERMSRVQVGNQVASSLYQIHSQVGLNAKKMAEIPKISIVTPSYNQGQFLEKTILSVLEQGYPNLEYIIIDGGSSDESVEIIKKYADRLTYWVSEPDRGQSHAINKGFERATGEILGWLNSDDWYHPGALKAVAEAFAANPEAGAVVGAGEMYYQESGKSLLIDSFEVTLESLYRFVDRYFCQPSCFFTDSAWNQCGPLDESLHLAMDLDLWLRFSKEFCFASIPDNLSVSLVHADAKTNSQAPASIVDACLVIGRHGGNAACRTKLVELVSVTREENATVHRKFKDVHDQLSTITAQFADLHKHSFETDRRLHDAEVTITSIEQSLSWRMTAPLRHIGDKLNSIK